MKDTFGRPITSLRISVTDRCNLSCTYCHREGLSSRPEKAMSAAEIGKIVGIAKEFGVRKVKLTGGEPLLRQDIVEIVKEIAMPGIEDISMTTNGVSLAGLARDLAEAGLTRINISLDTLNQETFHRVTGNGHLPDVLEGVDAAIAAGLKPVKLNMVLLAGVNDGELGELMAFASGRGAILQLIELLDLNGHDFRSHHKGLEDIERELEGRALEVRTRSMQARRKYVLPEGEVEVVRPMHNSEFCAHCTRLRLTPDGQLKPCLMRGDNLVDVISPVRKGDLEGTRRAFAEVIGRRAPFFKKY